MATAANSLNIGFIGLGKLGLPIAEVIGGRHRVTGFDILERTSSIINVTKDISEAVKGKDLVFVAVQTPHEPEYGGAQPVENRPNRDFDYSILKECLLSMRPYLDPGQAVAVISTVLPGTFRREFHGILPEARLLYNPYLIAMGTEQSDFLHPEMVILGSQRGCREELALIEEFYRSLLPGPLRIISGTWEEAEATKIFYNTFISAKLSIVNMIQDVAERIGHTNVDVVTTALAESSLRIMSPAYMKAGMGDGGPCHPRDNIALKWLSESLELGYDLFDGIVRSREAQAKNLAVHLLSKGRKVVILGKAFKPGVPYIDGSYSLLVGHYVEKLGGTLAYFDPKTGDTELPAWLEEAVFLIGHWEGWVPEFPFPKGAVLIDPWRMSPRLPGVSHLHYGDTRPGSGPGSPFSHLHPG